jgi:hypothetical protein
MPVFPEILVQPAYFFCTYRHFYYFSRSGWHPGLGLLRVFCWCVTTVSVLQGNPKYSVDVLFTEKQESTYESSLCSQACPWGQGSP